MPELLPTLFLCLRCSMNVGIFTHFFHVTLQRFQRLTPRSYTEVLKGFFEIGACASSYCAPLGAQSGKLAALAT